MATEIQTGSGKFRCTPLTVINEFITLHSKIENSKGDILFECGSSVEFVGKGSWRKPKGRHTIGAIVQRAKSLSNAQKFIEILLHCEDLTDSFFPSTTSEKDLQGPLQKEDGISAFDLFFQISRV